MRTMPERLVPPRESRVPDGEWVMELAYISVR